jgi:tetratricopeptide (TPR) repeat protein
MKRRTLLFLGGSLFFAFCAPPQAWATHALATRPDRTSTAPSNYEQGMALLKSRKYRQAETAFRQAINQKDHLVQSYAGLGYAATFLTDYPTAFVAYKKAHELQPKNDDYTYKTAYTALYSGDYHAALTYIDIFIKAEPRNAAGWHLRFLADGQLLRPKDEARDAGKVVQLQPKYGPAYNDWGIALAQIKEYKQAIAAFNQALKLDPNNWLYYKNRGVTENLNHQPALALKDLKRARQLTTDPGMQKQLDTVIRLLERQLHK